MKAFTLRSKRRKKLKQQMPPRRVKEKLAPREYRFGPFLSKYTLDRIKAWMWLDGKEVLVNGWFWRRILDKTKIKYFTRPKGKR